MTENAMNKYTPGPWAIEEVGEGAEIVNREHDGENWNIATVFDRANARLIAASPMLLAYAECEAAIACGRIDPGYDAQPVLLSHGWSGKENPGLFLSRIRRNAIEAATGNYLGRAA